jgi:hypothetical protein
LIIGVPKSLDRSICRFFRWVESKTVLIICSKNCNKSSPPPLPVTSLGGWSHRPC